MKPIDFSESTKVLSRPSTMSASDCGALPVWNDGKQCVSCWRANFRERLTILVRGKVWLGVLSGRTQPPVFLSGLGVFPKTPLISFLRAFWSDVREFVAGVWETVRTYAKQRDKRIHFIVGFAISLVVGTFTAWWIGFLVGLFAGAMKEWWDSMGHGTVEVADFVSTALGAACAMPFAALLHHLIF